MSVGISAADDAITQEQKNENARIAEGLKAALIEKQKAQQRYRYAIAAEEAAKKAERIAKNQLRKKQNKNAAEEAERTAKKAHTARLAAELETFIAEKEARKATYLAKQKAAERKNAEENDFEASSLLFQQANNDREKQEKLEQQRKKYIEISKESKGTNILAAARTAVARKTRKNTNRAAPITSAIVAPNAATEVKAHAIDEVANVVRDNMAKASKNEERLISELFAPKDSEEKPDAKKNKYKSLLNAENKRIASATVAASVAQREKIQARRNRNTRKIQQKAQYNSEKRRKELIADEPLRNKAAYNAERARRPAYLIATKELIEKERQSRMKEATVSNNQEQAEQAERVRTRIDVDRAIEEERDKLIIENTERRRQQKARANANLARANAEAELERQRRERQQQQIDAARSNIDITHRTVAQKRAELHRKEEELAEILANLTRAHTTKAARNKIVRKKLDANAVFLDARTKLQDAMKPGMGRINNSYFINEKNAQDRKTAINTELAGLVEPNISSLQTTQQTIQTDLSRIRSELSEAQQESNKKASELARLERIQRHNGGSLKKRNHTHSKKRKQRNRTRR